MIGAAVVIIIALVLGTGIYYSSANRLSKQQKVLDLFLDIYEAGYATCQRQENIAILYENMQRFDEAEEMLLAMAESYPERYEVYKRLAYLEADRQQTEENENRNYQQMLVYYEQAEDRYSGEEQDAEMDMLDVMMQEIRGGGQEDQGKLMSEYE